MQAKKHGKERGFTLADLMTVAASREIRDGEVVMAGMGMPILAIMLAKKTHAPNLKLMFEAGTFDSNPAALPTSVGDPRCIAGSSRSSGQCEAFFVAQRGCVDVGFLTGVEIDEYGNVNTTVIGSYLDPELRLTGSGGTPDICSFADRTIYVMLHEPRRFVEQVSYITSPGWRVKEWPSGEFIHRRELYGSSFRGGPSAVISTAGVFRFDDQTGRMYLETYHPEQTPEDIAKLCLFDLDIGRVKGETPPPTPEELFLIHEVLDKEEFFLPRSNIQSGKR